MERNTEERFLQRVEVQVEELARQTRAPYSESFSKNKHQECHLISIHELRIRTQLFSLTKYMQAFKGQKVSQIEGKSEVYF
jgi:hypothetical protein